MPEYTVVGMYRENHQVYVTSIQAPDPRAAAEEARAEADPEIYVLCVFEGAYEDLYCEDEMMRG